MSRPPIKSMESIKNYCEKTQCRRCVFGRTRDDDYHYVDAWMPLPEAYKKGAEE